MIEENLDIGWSIMKRQGAQLIILILVTMSMLPTAVLSQETHSLEWGVEIGEEYTYALQRKYGDQEFLDYIAYAVPFIRYLDEGQKMTANFTSLDEIPIEINSSANEPKSYCDLIRQNDSVTVLTASNGFAVPIGDWQFIANLRNITEDNGYTIIDTTNEWGYYASGYYPGLNEVIVYQELRYEKTNGTLTYYQWSITQYSMNLLDIVLARWEPGMPTILPMGLDLSFYLIAGIAVCVALVCGFLTYCW
jgi:hypothetical protein